MDHGKRSLRGADRSTRRRAREEKSKDGIYKTPRIRDKGWAEDPWIKKMQEISRQGREKWPTYGRNGKRERLALEESAEANELINVGKEIIPL